jgi:serine phosphatase RsbU (regulator of sigma subunit)/pSer/pThr/pTyr-binding forkhead associated (FHA) protein
MALLQILKGPNQGTRIPLDGERFVLGRNPECQIVIPVTSVSREHAQILRVQARFFIEDLHSRNGTFVNNQAITGRTQLKNNDRIRICDFVAAFLESEPAPDEGPEDEEDEVGGSTTVEATLSQHSSNILETQPADKLRGLLEISASLSSTLELDPLLPKIVDSLFQLFKQADRAFIILGEPGQTRLMPKVVKTRRPQDEPNARFSRSIVRQCLQTNQAFLSDDASQDNRIQLSQSVVDFRIRSVMCVPLCGPGGTPFGVIQLDTQDRAKKFTKADLELLWGVANQASIALENAKLHQESITRERAQERMKRDMELAHQVQLGFLPRELPQMPGYEFYAFYEPALDVGGDYYGFIPLASGHLVAAIGDVAGKGVPAALFMAKLASDARFCFSTESEPARAVGKLNDFLAEQCAQHDRFVTFAAAILDPHSHTVTLVNAGHIAPLLYRQADESFAEAITRKLTGLPLGVMEGYPFDVHQFTLKPGDGLLMFTDGVLDAVNEKEEQLGAEGVHAALQGIKTGSPKAQIERLVQAVRDHAAGRAQFDDITLVGFGRVL